MAVCIVNICCLLFESAGSETADVRRVVVARWLVKGSKAVSIKRRKRLF